MTIVQSLPVAAAVAAPACPPVAGAGALLATAGIRWLVVGEVHGTAETPARFGDLVCLAASRDRPVVVALEWPTPIQPALDAWLASDGGPDARATLLARPFWHGTDQDGRTSRAMLDLADRLRRLHGAGLVSRVIAFRPVPAAALDAAGTERAMAEEVRAAAPPRGGPTLVLMGNLHARLAPLPGFTDYPPMAAWLPAAATVVVDATGDGGTAWTCETAGPDMPVTCAPHGGPDHGARHAPGLLPVDGAAGRRWTWRLGGPTSASPPALP